MDTDLILGICSGLGMAVCCVGVVLFAWRETAARRHHMKISRSDPDLVNIVTEELASA
jgi:hypothetical protein